MIQAGQVAAKDVHRLRWVMIGWIAIVAARTLVATVGADVALAGFGPQLGIAQVSQLLLAIYVLVLTLLISSLVHADALVGSDAFWITRPVVPASLMAAKLSFTAMFFLIVPLIGHVIVAWFFGMRAGEVAKTVPVFLLNHLIVVTLLMALAVVTPSLARYLIAVVAAASGFVIFATAAIMAALLGTTEVVEEGDVSLPDPTHAVLGAMLISIVAVAVIVYQYRHRHVGRALTLAGIGGIAVFVILQAWTRSFASGPTIETAAPPPNSSDLSVSLDANHPRVIDEFALNRRTAPRKDIAVHALVAGVPSAFIVRTLVARSRLIFPDGVVLQTGSARQAGATLVGNIGGSTSGRNASVEAAVGARLLTGNDPAERAWSQQWPVVVRVDESEFDRHRRDRGQLTADVDVLFERAVMRGALPLAETSTAVLGETHVSIVRVIRHATGCTVLLRRAFVESLFTAPRSRDIIYVLRNVVRGEAVGGDVRPLSEEGFTAGRWFVPSPVIGGRGFVLDQYEIQFPANRSPEAAPVDLEQAWVAGAELLVLETIPAGRISRTVAVDGFRMAP